MFDLFEAERRAAVEAVVEAAWVCRAVQSEISPESLSKRDKSPVTVADFASQALVCRRLAEQFPDDPIVAEEDAAELRDAENAAITHAVVRQVRGLRHAATVDDACAWIDLGGAETNLKRFWTLDPIDGTKGFLRKEQYAIALALIVEGRVVLAALGCPNLSGGTIYIAVRGQGAFVRLLGGDGSEHPVRVSSCQDSSAARFCESVESGHSAHGDSEKLAARIGITRPPVRLDSQAKYAVVARGEAELYLRLPTRADYLERIWDHAAGALIVEEAGGTVTDIDGKPLDFTRGRELAGNRGVVVGNPSLHSQVIRAIAALDQ
jgi:3'(2'), 5'-bisphosphate nucleotidase